MYNRGLLLGVLFLLVVGMVYFTYRRDKSQYEKINQKIIHPQSVAQERDVQDLDKIVHPEITTSYLSIVDEEQAEQANDDIVKAKEDILPTIDMNLVQQSGKQVYAYLEKIRQDCGELCNTSRKGAPGPFFQHITSAINCKSLYQNPYIDMGHNLKHAPAEIPQELLQYYNMDGQLPVSPFYFNKKYLGSSSLMSVWSKMDIENRIQLAKMGKLRGNYGAHETNALRDGLLHTPGVSGGRVLVIGSEKPWVEACCLEAGAREIITLEYGKLKSEHDSVKAIVPAEFRERYLNGTLGLFDAVVTFSSVEHSGLGRYGDALNPWGDIIAIAKAWCVTKPNGGLAIGVPFNKMEDSIAYNAHRVYGEIRYPFLATNWRQIYEGEGRHHFQRMHVFSKR